tara:strand:+ start:440 stop:589 length:150 start_codon:yes stop_codon:yes gene_type:complete
MSRNNIGGGVSDRIRPDYERQLIRIRETYRALDAVLGTGALERTEDGPQ